MISTLLVNRNELCLKDESCAGRDDTWTATAVWVECEIKSCTLSSGSSGRADHRASHETPMGLNVFKNQYTEMASYNKTRETCNFSSQCMLKFWKTHTA